MPRFNSAPRTAPPLWTPHPGGCPRLTGAAPTPPHLLMAAMPFRPLAAAPPQFAYVPSKLSMWGNNQYGDCVSAEEAFAKACNVPEIFIDDATVIAWARRGGFLDGADLSEVMDAMAKGGFTAGAQLYDDGPHQTVDFGTESVLQAAIAEGPVKIAIDSSALPQGAGNQQGWSAFGGGRYGNTDHCVGLAGYGPPDWLARQLGVGTPGGAPAVCYLLFTWSTIGFVSHDWLMGTCAEAHVRTPTTVGVPPLPAPTLPVDWTP